MMTAAAATAQMLLYYQFHRAHPSSSDQSQSSPASSSFLTSLCLPLHKTTLNKSRRGTAGSAMMVPAGLGYQQRTERVLLADDDAAVCRLLGLVWSGQVVDGRDMRSLGEQGV